MIETPKLPEMEPEMPMRVYNYQDYASIAEDVEIFSGRVYMMSSPNHRHQVIAGTFYAQLVQQLRGKPCTPVMDEDVELYPDADDTEEFSVVRPDVFIVCDPAKIESPTGHIKGAPDFILEVLSPSTASTDLMLKAYHYAKTGVKEYWILDPASRRLTICTIEHDGFYGKRDINARGKIKLATMELFIDFDEVFERFPD